MCSGWCRACVSCAARMWGVIVVMGVRVCVSCCVVCRVVVVFSRDVADVGGA